MMYVTWLLSSEEFIRVWTVTTTILQVSKQEQTLL